MPPVCGIDLGSFVSPSYVAWLDEEGGLVFDLHRVRPDRLLPEPPPGWPAPAWVAVDGPQGLARPGRKRRTADAEADTPTRVLPADRRELADWRLYRRLIEAGIELFWRCQAEDRANLFGLAPSPELTITLGETYPRWVARRLWPDLALPSKRKAPEGYVEEVWDRVVAAGYRCPGVARPAVDQVDATLCALAAQAALSHDGPPPGTVGEAPWLDGAAEVVREGFIVAP